MNNTNYELLITELRSTLARFAKTLCTKELDHTKDESLGTYVACRLIPLDKKPGIRPIGVGEVLRRLIGKSIISVIKPDVLESAGSLQLCAGLRAGCEAAAHAMTTIFEEEGRDALLLVDATNAFNSLKHCAYSDDLGGAGKILELEKWWEQVEHYGPLFGYYPKATKSWLIMKDKHLETAKELFHNTNINITTTGQNYLGSFIGNKESKENYIKQLVNEWIVQVDKLAKIALYEPQAEKLQSN